MKLLIINTLSIFILSYLGIGIHVTGFVPALLVAIVFAILNIVGLVTFLIAPFILFHIFGLIVYEGILFWITSLIVTGFIIVSFPWAILNVIILGVINLYFTPNKKRNAR